MTVPGITVARMTSIPPPRPALPDSERQAILSQAVATSVGKGFRVESQTPHHAVLVTGRRANHTLHAIITLFSCGAWGFVWLYLGMTRKEKRVVLQVDPNGKVIESR